MIRMIYSTSCVKLSACTRLAREVNIGFFKVCIRIKFAIITCYQPECYVFICLHHPSHDHDTRVRPYTSILRSDSTICNENPGNVKAGQTITDGYFHLAGTGPPELHSGEGPGGQALLRDALHVLSPFQLSFSLDRVKHPPGFLPICLSGYV